MMVEGNLIEYLALKLCTVVLGGEMMICKQHTHQLSHKAIFVSSYQCLFKIILVDKK